MKRGIRLIRVLLVEDNKEINENIYLYLKDELDITRVYSGEDAIDYMRLYSYDVVILDLMLPEINGLEVLKYISSKNLNTGVIILTAKEQLEDKLRAFEIGANDYMTKPFFMEELKARINVILKTMGKIKNEHTLEFKDMTIDMKTKKVHILDEEIILKDKIYNLLEYLVINKGVLLFKEQIFDSICGFNSDASTEIVEVYMSRLRRSLKPYGYDKYIKTKRGLGYVLGD